MTEHVPILVVMYMRVKADEPAKPIAEFRWSPETGVTLIELDPLRSSAAKEIYEHGVEHPYTGRYVPRSDGTEFMRTLVLPTRMTFFGFVDESDVDETEEE